MTQDEARARVAKGAAHLDQMRPGWFNRIDTGTLTLHDPCGCIVGQLMPEFKGMVCGFYDGLRALGIGGRQAGGGALGFVLTPEDTKRDDIPVDTYPHPIYASLQEAWIEAIADRLLPTTDGAKSHVSTGVRDTGAVPQFRG